MCTQQDPVESWPVCDCLISFHSKGFPLEKAIQYAQLRKPYVINNLHMQYDIQVVTKLHARLKPLWSFCFIFPYFIFETYACRIAAKSTQYWKLKVSRYPGTECWIVIRPIQNVSVVCLGMNRVRFQKLFNFE